MFTFTATATVPWELQHTAKARSARVKMAPPCTTSTAFRWRDDAVIRARA
jgi:hypothetical protein